MPVFQNLPMQHIHLINSIEQCLVLEQELKSCALLGFDTESKPTFAKGEVSTGPHLIQLASQNKAYLFQINPEILEFLKPVFENRDQVKVGFGLKNDAHLFRKKGIELNSVIELSKCFSTFGFPNPMGLKNAMALLFQLNFPKSKKISTSNWARKILTPPQIQYAAADAYAPVLVFEELLRLGLLPKHIPNTSLKLRIRPNKIKAETDA
ncbi:3'-5' exonuclease [Acinetobacter terrae]|uniref:3'-5' exonuclease n=1 Tax=Acinetobacter terrae TaxID=2731247 RepID=UPI001D1793A6|nr:3'-5' exonuclease [Acinetobacter terrae]